MSDEYFIIEGEASKSKNKKKKVTVLVGRKGRGEKRRVFYLLYGEEFSSSSSASLPHLNRGAASFCDLTVIGHRLFYLSRQGMKLERGRLPFGGSVSCHSLSLEEVRPRRWDSAKAIRIRPDHNPSDYYESSDKLEWMLPGAPQDCFWQAKFGICGLAFASSAKVAGSPPGHGSGKLTLMCSGTVTHDLLQHLDRNAHHIERSRVEFTSNAALAVVTVRRSNSHAGEGELRVVDTRTGTTLHRVLYAYDEGPVWWGMLETPPQGSGEDAFFWLALWVSTARRIADKTFHFLSCGPRLGTQSERTLLPHGPALPGEGHAGGGASAPERQGGQVKAALCRADGGQKEDQVIAPSQECEKDAFLLFAIFLQDVESRWLPALHHV